MTTRKLIAALGAAALLLPLVSPAGADDRNLFAFSNQAPYLFVLIDNTGSMNSPTDPNNPAPARDNDPNSRLYQVKSGLDTVLTGTTGVNFGFATYPDQDALEVRDRWSSPWWGTVYCGGSPNTCLFQNSTGWCSGWEGNGDSGNDPGSDNINLHQDTVTDPATGLQYGDIIPLNWNDDNIERIRERLGPNLLLGEASPDFGTVRYVDTSDPDFNDGSQRLRDPDVRPIVASGNTPITEAMRDFRAWHQNWRPVAEANDPDLARGCRDVSLLLMTDGFHNCSTTQPHVAASELVTLDPPVVTFPIAFATSNTSQMDAIADAVTNDHPENNDGVDSDGDGSDVDIVIDGDPSTPGNQAWLAQSEQEFVDAVLAIKDQITAQARAFASAAVPSVSATATDKIFLSDFSPLSDAGIWPARVNAYTKPLPRILQNGRFVADRNDTDCTDEDGCLVWDAGEQIVLQADDINPSATGSDVNGDGDIDSEESDFTEFDLGDSEEERRLWYAKFQDRDLGEVPLQRQFPDVNEYHGGDSEIADANPNAVERDDARLELYGPRGMGLNPASPDFDQDGRDVLEELLRPKSTKIPDPADPSGPAISIEYVLGDVFHSDPVFAAEPDRFRYAAQDLYGDGTDCSAGNPGYRCYFRTHEHRRKMLLFNSNDGQLHGIDAGMPFPDGTEVKFDDGTGREIFSFMPRGAMENVKEAVTSDSHRFSNDGVIRVDDVFVDPVHAGAHVGSPDPPDADEREWRTVAVSGQREGGRSYYGLDLTQPDLYDGDGIAQPVGGDDTAADNYVPSCHGAGGSLDPDCGPVPFPSVLWEFTDTWDEDLQGTHTNGTTDDDSPDLGDTWSRVNTGIVRVCESAPCNTDPDTGNVVDKFVAIFGGGLDADRKRDIDEAADQGNPEPTGPYSGNWLYMVDIETGKTIYKRRLDQVDGTTVPNSMAPSDPAAVDKNQNGVLDTIYIGTTAGYMYKVDISQPQPLETFDVQIDDLSPPTMKSVTRVTSSEWDPFAIFDTEGRPIYFPPAVFFAGQAMGYGLDFSTGDRENLWSPTTVNGGTGRFYAIIDENFTPSTPGLPFTAAQYEEIAPTDAPVSTGTDFLADPNAGKNHGWYMELIQDERLVTKPFALGGITIFSTYIPEETGGGDQLCRLEGRSRLYAVFTTNANPVLGPEDPDDPASPKRRFREVNDLVTNPFAEEGDRDSAENPPGYCPTEVMQTLMEQMPSTCEFGNFSINIQTIRSDTGLECIAPVPVCIQTRNWKETDR